MLNDTYFVLGLYPESMNITDFRGHQYNGLEQLNPEQVSRGSQVNARDFLRGLADVDSSILECKSSQELKGKLESLTERADMSADSGPMPREKTNHLCAIRDNINQLIRYLE